MLYLRKRNSKNDAFFQRTLTNLDQSCDVWYNNAPIGHNTLGCMMLTISKASGLSRNYTNYCVVATTAAGLPHTGVSSVGIMSVTGCRNEQNMREFALHGTASQISVILQQVATGQVDVSSPSSFAPSSL